ncbi:Lrp/AsnC family transcriptional regulator [Rhodovibrionaceae bacterium A322]
MNKASRNLSRTFDPVRELDGPDRLLINELQEGFPLTPRPYQSVARRLGLTEDDVLARLQRLLKLGYLTRFGPLFDADKLGGAFCLCALQVPDEDFATVMTKVNAYPEVAHNYERDHSLNMWFVLAVEKPEQIAETAEKIERECNLKVHLFPKEEEYFIGLRVTA